MGTFNKGGSKYFRSIGQNILITKSKYKFANGYFGTDSSHGGASTRNISSRDNLVTAEDFYNRIAFGGSEVKHNYNMRITTMADGTKITMRIVSTSDGTPAIDINIKNSTHTGGIKKQKIHFVKERQE